MISNEAKERKMRQKIESEMQEREQTWVRTIRRYCTTYIFPITTLVACGATLYFWRKSDKNKNNHLEEIIIEKKEEKKENKKKEKRFEEF